MQTTTNVSFPRAGWLSAWLRPRITRGVAKITRTPVKERATDTDMQKLVKKFAKDED